MKTCVHCQSTDTPKWYSGPKCKQCYQLEWQRNNRDKTRAHALAWARQNRDRMREYGSAWYVENKERLRVTRGEHYAKNSTQYTARCAKRRAAKLKAMPGWVDTKELRTVYLNCPPGHEVDHIIPLQGKNVCGLHVPWNLQYLSRAMNRAKGNRV